MADLFWLLIGKDNQYYLVIEQYIFLFYFTSFSASWTIHLSEECNS